MARKRLVTVEQAVLLHLLDCVKFAEQDTVPLETTQAGISHALGVRRSHVAQSLDAAIGQGNAEEHLSRVKGEKRKRKCYFLTPKGLAQAKSVKETVSGTVVDSELPGGENFNGALSALAEKLQAGLPSLSLLVSEGRVRLPAPASQEPGTERIPPVQFFYGRSAELETVGRLLGGRMRVLGVTGMPGIGKTALLARAVGQCKARVFWFSVTEWTGPKHAAKHLASFLSVSGSDRLERYLDAHEVPDPGDIHDILASEKLRAVMVFDDCHRAGVQMQSFLDMLVRAANDSPGLGICLSGRRLRSLEGTEPARLSAELISLGPLDRESGMEILRQRGISGEKAKALEEKGQGHPLFLTLAGEAGKGDIGEMLAREVQHALSPAENSLMLQMSVYRQPVPAEALAESAEDMAALESLADRCLLVHSDMWSMHSLLREFFLARQSASEKGLRHERAAEYYARYDRTASGRVEELNHLFMAGDFESAAMGLAEAGPDMLALGYTDEVLALCAAVPGAWENRDEANRISFLKASALDLLGQWAEASQIYRTCLSAARESGDPEAEAAALRRLGAIEYRKGDLPEAAKLLQEALGLLESGPLQAEVMGSLGVIHWKIGDLAAAAASHSADLGISEKAGDLRGISRALNNLGILDWQAGDNQAALEKYSRALVCAEKLADSRLVAILYSNMGDVHRSMGNPADAERYYGRCLALAEDLRFSWQIAEAYRGLAEVVPGRRRDYLSRALTIFERLGAEEDAKIVKGMMG